MVQISAPYEKVWKIISDVDNDPSYWKGIVRIRNTSREKNSVVREAQLLDGSKCQQKITLFPKEGIHMRWTKGTMLGIKDIMLIDNGSSTVIRVQINYKHDVPRTEAGGVIREMQSEAERALRLIKRAAESKSQTRPRR